MKRELIFERLEWLVLGASQRECKSFFLLNSTSRCASSNDKIVIASLALPVFSFYFLNAFNICKRWEEDV